MLYKDRLTEADADFLDDLFSQHEATWHLRVDRARLDDSMEAWIYVDINKDKIAYPEDLYNIPFHGFNAAKGVLTWENSD